MLKVLKKLGPSLWRKRATTMAQGDMIDLTLKLAIPVEVAALLNDELMEEIGRACGEAAYNVVKSRGLILVGV